MTGAAAVFFPRNNDAFPLAVPSPFDSSGDAEFWALLSCLRFLRTHKHYSAVSILSDNSEVVSVIKYALDLHNKPEHTFSAIRPKSKIHKYS